MKWPQAIVEIVKLFRPHERPIAALCALAIVIAIPAAATVLLASYAKNVGQTALATKVERR